MRVYNSLEANNLSDLADKLNNINGSDIKIEFIERRLPMHQISILYSHECTIVRKPKETQKILKNTKMKDTDQRFIDGSSNS